MFLFFGFASSAISSLEVKLARLGCLTRRPSAFVIARPVRPLTSAFIKAGPTTSGTAARRICKTLHTQSAKYISCCEGEALMSHTGRAH